jgi:hypothetical protein
MYEVPDARLDQDFAPDGILLDSRSYRFYAGAPLSTPAGVNIGTLAVVDRHPRRLTDAQSNALSILSRQVITRLELNGRIRQMDRAAPFAAQDRVCPHGRAQLRLRSPRHHRRACSRLRHRRPHRAIQSRM